MNLIKRSVLSITTLVFILNIPAYSQNIPHSSYFYNHGKRIYFKVSSDKITIRTVKNLSSASIRQSLSMFSSYSLSSRHTKDIEPGKNQLLKLSDKFEKGSIYNKLDVLNTDPNIEYAVPVLEPLQSFSPMGLTNRVNVQFVSNLTLVDIQNLISRTGGKIVEPISFLKNGYSIEIPVTDGKNSVDVANMLYESGKTVFSEPEFVVERKIRFTPNDPNYSNQWHLNNTGQSGALADADVDAPEAWDLSRGTTSIIVAILDEGIEYTHEDLNAVGKIFSPYDVVNNNNNPSPQSGEYHGTSCSGVAVAIGNNGIGVSGVAPNCGLMPIRLLDAAMTSTDEAKAFTYAADSGASIQSNSWGPPDGDPTVSGDEAYYPIPDISRAGLDYATDSGRNGKGCAIFWAAGNGNELVSLDGYASYNRVIAVAAVNDRGIKSYYSDFGPEISVCAPSSGDASYDSASTTGIWTTDVTGSSGYSSTNYADDFGGTSSASPLAAGVGALVLSANPNLDWLGLKFTLERTAEKINTGYDSFGHSTIYGYGRVNAYSALTSVMEADVTSPGQITNLTVSTNPIIKLEWTATGDDGSSGRALYYDIRYSSSTITPGNFLSGSRYIFFQHPQTALAMETTQVMGLSEGSTYFFAMRAVDNVGNVGPVSNVVTALSPLSQALFSDTIESGTFGWSTQSPWSQITTTSHSPTHCWTDSPSGNYSNSKDVSLTSPTFSLVSVVGARVEFWDKFNIEEGYDFGYLEISTTNGSSWIRTNYIVTGLDSTSFSKRSLDISAYDGKPNLKIRFRLITDSSVTKDGWYVDDVEIRGFAATAVSVKDWMVYGL